MPRQVPLIDKGHTNKMTASYNWEPTDKLLHGKIVKPFLPLKRHPKLSLQNKHFSNLYPGNEVYVFEQTTDGKWCRGYLSWQPLPEDFVAYAGTFTEKLPEQKFQVVLFPKAFAHLYYEQDITSVSFLNMPEKKDFKDSSDNPDLPSLHQLNEESSISDTPQFKLLSDKKRRPPFPLFRLQNTGFLNEIAPMLGVLVSHIYSMYSFGEFEIAQNLTELYYELDSIHLKLQLKLTTGNERKKVLKAACALLCKISRFISSKGMRNKFEHVHSTVVDPSGYESILSRDINSGELYDYVDTTPQLLASSTMLSALTTNFPVSNLSDLELVAPKNTKYDPVEPSQILVDFKEVTSAPSLDPQFQNLSAYMYLRTNKRVLTEPFIVNIDSENITSLDHISAALFNNIPATEIDHGRIYLAVVLTETLNVSFRSVRSTREFKPPFVPFESTTEGSIVQVRRGVAAGVADVSRIFSRHRGSLASGESHHFKIELFASYFSVKQNETPPLSSNTSKSPDLSKIMATAMNHGANNGWGELIDRIISDSNKGIAVNPRAESLSVTVKEIQSDSSYAKVANTGMSAIQNVLTCFYDTLSPSTDRIYLTLGKVSLCNMVPEETNIKNITIQLTANNRKIFFRKGSNELQEDRWRFISVKPNEAVGETIRIDGISSMMQDETLRISAYVNGYLMAKSKFYIKRGNQIIEYKKSSVFQLMSTVNKPLLEVEIGTEYVGSIYNMEGIVHDILSLLRKSQYQDSDFESKCTRLLHGLKSVGTKQLIKYFNPLLTKMLELFYVVNVSNAKESSEAFKEAVFTSLLYLLDIVVAREDTHKHLFNDFYKVFDNDISKLPDIGPALIATAAYYFSNSHLQWNHIGRALCRVSYFLFKLSLLTSKHRLVELKVSWDSFFTGVFKFFVINNNSVMTDQVLILEAFDVWVTVLSGYFNPKTMLEYSLGLLQACHEKEQNSGMDKRALTVKEEKFINSKLLLMRRLMNHEFLTKFLFTSGCDEPERSRFLFKVIEWAVQPFLKHNGKYLDLTSIRLANGLLVTIIKHSKDVLLQRNLVRLLPTICRFFILVRKHCKENDLFKFRRTFTSLFPITFPFPEITVDSIVNEEIIIEALMELATIIASITKIAETRYKDNLSFIYILQECAEDEIFDSIFYISQFAREDLLSIIHTVKLIIKGKFFPSKKWLALNALLIRSSMTLLALCKDLIIKYKVPEGCSGIEDFDIKLWFEYFKTILLLANHRISNPNSLSDIPRKAVYKISGDLRETAAGIVEECWDALGEDTTGTDTWKRFGVTRAGGYQSMLSKYSNSLVREFLVFAFHRHTEARRVGTKILWVTGINVWNHYGTLQPAINLCTPEFFNAYQAGKFVPSIHELESFSEGVLLTVHVKKTDPAFSALVHFVKALQEFLHVIAESEEIPSGEEFDDDRTARQITIFGYLMEANRPESFHKLVNNLFIYNIKKKDYVQAALSLELLAGTYKWNPNDHLAPTSQPPLPAQSSFERKEYLYKEAARNFAKGLKLEKALSTYKDLAKAYDEINYDLNGLAFVHGQISNLYTDLQSVDRLVPTYFKVSFIGFGFPNSTRGKVFVYEGLPFEHITSIHNRLLKLYPGSTIVQTQENADELLMHPPLGKYLHVIAVEPQLDISDEFVSNDKKNLANNKIRQYIENRDLKTFSSSRVLPGASSVTDMWVKEFTYETVSTFPTLMNRTEVKKISEKVLSPVENAIRSLQLKIQELTGLENMCYKLIKENGEYSEIFGELSRNISGTIDAPINGGVSRYREFFKATDAKAEFKESDTNLLQSAFDELAVVLSRCLALHDELCPVDLRKSHRLLLELFEKNFAQEIKSSGINLNENTKAILTRIRTIQSSQQSFQKRQSTMLPPKSLLVDGTSSVHSSDSSSQSMKGSISDASKISKASSQRVDAQRPDPQRLDSQRTENSYPASKSSMSELSKIASRRSNISNATSAKPPKKRSLGAWSMRTGFL